MAWGWPGLPLMSNLSGPFQHFRAAILGAWRDAVSADLFVRKGFRGGPLFDIDGTLQLLNSDHVRERDKALLRSILVGGVWNGFLLGKIQGQGVPCRFCGGRDSDGHLFWDCTFVNILSFMIFLRWIRLLGLGAFFGMVGYPFSQALMVVLLGLRPLLKALLIFLRWCALGRYSSGSFLSGGCLLVLMLKVLLGGSAGEPDVWTDGSLVDDKVSGFLLLERGALPFGFVGFGLAGIGSLG